MTQRLHSLPWLLLQCQVTAWPGSFTLLLNLNLLSCYLNPLFCILHEHRQHLFLFSESFMYLNTITLYLLFVLQNKQTQIFQSLHTAHGFPFPECCCAAHCSWVTEHKTGFRAPAAEQEVPHVPYRQHLPHLRGTLPYLRCVHCQLHIWCLTKTNSALSLKLHCLAIHLSAHFVALIIHPSREFFLTELTAVFQTIPSFSWEKAEL